MRGLMIAALVGIAALGSASQGDEVKSEIVDYRHGEVALQGYLAWKPGGNKKLPAVIVFHEWKGHGDYVRKRADQLARLGYLAFAADMYGKGVYAKDHEEAGKLAGVYFNDRPKMRERAKAALDTLLKHPMCDSSKVAAMGYCFGGTTSLEMARAGYDLRGVASFHGNLSRGPADSDFNRKVKVIVFHGMEDKFVPEEVVQGFHAEMKEGKVDYQFVGFGGAVHSFTVKEAGDDPKKGMAYDEKADKRSWEMLQVFLKECFQ